ncbi:hypothetical protein [Vibrio coralliilyticus]|uniref:hypothetical protein n=1 Tax=Vibrio coralliilyticus TaxID=190893 RepID=UPI00178DF2AB|nr:hypothetical protein [Vibrio coralliilyticus]NUW69236.1 hypothetical protein [Vibrio coralliilyticus]
MINKYQVALDAYIAEQRTQPLVRITNHNDEQASWSDWVWVVRFPNNTNKSFYFWDPNLVRRPRLRPNQPYSGTQLLPEKTRSVMMAYLLHLLSDKGNYLPSTLTALQLASRFFLTYLNGELINLNQEQINNFFHLNRRKHHIVKLGRFISWCQDQHFIRSTLRTPSINSKYRGKNISVEETGEWTNEKMPDERALRALGAIFNEVIPETDALHAIDLYGEQRSAFVASMCAMAMSSPNRLAAEQLTLTNQQLKSRTAIRIKSGKQVSQKIYWLDWCGSKGYKDNDNHILASMADPVNRALEYLNAICEPARVLCRFYEAPNLPLNKILGSFRTEKAAEYPKSCTVNLFQLGYILGFYDHGDDQMPVASPHSPNIDYKHVSKLSDSDVLRFNITSLKHFIGIKTNDTRRIEAIVGRHPTVAAFQKNWIAHMKRAVPTFPDRINGSNRVRLANALFNFTGKQITQVGQAGGYKLSGSYYSIEPVKLRSLLNRKLSGNANLTSIFEDFSFSSDIRIRPHQFRHWINTKAQESLLSDEVIAMWSGRTSVQQNVIYDHTPDSDKIARLAELHTPTGNVKKEIRIITLDKYQQITGKAASITATGICTQELSVNPCTYLNDFVTQCVLCPSLRHVNRDQKAINILEKDLSVQQLRLEQVQKSERLRNKIQLQNWFLVHHGNTVLLNQLIELMKCEDIKEGSPIHYVANRAVFRITDVDNKRINEVKALLPNSQAELDKLIANTPTSNQPTANTALNDLLASFGINQE